MLTEFFQELLNSKNNLILALTKEERKILEKTLKEKI